MDCQELHTYVLLLNSQKVLGIVEYAHVMNTG